MLECVEKSYLKEIYYKSGQALSQTTSLLAELDAENILMNKSNFKNPIEYLNKKIFEKKIARPFEDMLFESFPHINKSIVYEIYQTCNNDIIKTFKILGSLPNDELEEKKEIIKENIINKYNEDYPSLIKDQQTKVKNQSVWTNTVNNPDLINNNIAR